MSSSLLPGPQNFTRDRLHAVLIEDQLASYRISMYGNAEYDANYNLQHMKRFCLNLYASVQDHLAHRERIDGVFARFQPRLRVHIPANEVCILTTIFEAHGPICRTIYVVG